MVFIEPPRSAVIEKRLRNVAEAKRMRAQSATRLQSLTPQQRDLVTPFLTSVNSLCSHYTSLANANFTSTAAASPANVPAASEKSGTSTKIRPSSANVLRFSHDVQYRSPCAATPRPEVLLPKVGPNNNIISVGARPSKAPTVTPIAYPTIVPSGEVKGAWRAPDPDDDLVSKPLPVEANTNTNNQSPKRVRSPSPDHNALLPHSNTLLYQIGLQVQTEADDTYRHLKQCYADYKESSKSPKAGTDGEEDHMLPLMVENIINESMRSVAEQHKSVLGYDPYKNAVVDFTNFADKNSLLEFIGGQSDDANGVYAHLLANKSNTQRHKLDVLAHQLSRGFSHKGLEIAKELPVAIIFPCFDELAASSSDGKRPLNRKRFDIHTRCMLIGTLKPPADAWGKASCLGHLNRPNPNQDLSSAFDPSRITVANATTVTSEANFKQERRREMRDRIRINRSLQKISAGSSASASVERQVEAAKEAQRQLIESSIKPRTNEEILEEVISDRRGYKLSEAVLDALTHKMQLEAQPLRPMRDIHRVKVPDFIEYRDCTITPTFLVTYEVPNNKLDAPTRSTLDPAALLTTKASMFDDTQPFERLEYTMRWGAPIGSLTPASFSSDCWVRKVIRISSSTSLTSNVTNSNEVPMGPLPLGVLLQACGRGTVSIDVQGTALSRNNTSKAPPHYRHSFMFTERGVAAVLKDRRYGKNARCLKHKPAGGVAGLRAEK